MADSTPPNDNFARGSFTWRRAKPWQLWGLTAVLVVLVIWAITALT